MFNSKQPVKFGLITTYIFSDEDSKDKKGKKKDKDKEEKPEMVAFGEYVCDFQNLPSFFKRINLVCEIFHIKIPVFND